MSRIGTKTWWGTKEKETRCASADKWANSFIQISGTVIRPIQSHWFQSRKKNKNYRFSLWFGIIECRNHRKCCQTGLDNRNQMKIRQIYKSCTLTIKITIPPPSILFPALNPISKTKTATVCLCVCTNFDRMGIVDLPSDYCHLLHCSIALLITLVVQL